VRARQDTVNYPVHIKNFNLAQLRQLCKELRSDIIHTVSKTGGARHSGPVLPRGLRCAGGAWRRGGPCVAVLHARRLGTDSACRNGAWQRHLT